MYGVCVGVDWNYKYHVNVVMPSTYYVLYYWEFFGGGGTQAGGGEISAPLLLPKSTKTRGVGHYLDTGLVGVISVWG